jgi:membrane glycosyltransferase
MIEGQAQPSARMPAAEDRRGRRLLFALLTGATILGMIGLMVQALSAGGFGMLDLALVALFAVTLPWTVIGFWNAAIGFLLLRVADDPVAAVFPLAARVRGDEPVTASTAILLCVRNEAPERMIRNLQPLLAGLSAAGLGDRFHLYILSDTSEGPLAAREEARFAAFAAQWQGAIGITYRRRAVNTGYKAGNIRDFCARFGARHDFALVLDADSVMPADAVLRLVRIMQADPQLGILQALVAGLPTTSAFARIFQFGMRLGMASYTLGSAWWQGDCGPYWGHNALLRLRPFMQHCALPEHPGRGVLGGAVLSHDQIEAALMRRAGYGVRVLPEDGLGWEENPPTLLEFLRRDLRWCQGNMQYFAFLGLPGLAPVSRHQLAVAILMFLGSPAWICLLVLATLLVAASPEPAQWVHAGSGHAVFGLVLAMWFAPKFATVIDILCRPQARALFGGTPRFLASVAVETLFFILLCPIMWVSHTLFMAGLPFGRAIGWIGQTRDDHAVAVRRALRDLWPHTLIGVGSLAALAATHPGALVYAWVLAAGPALAVPLAVVTAHPRLGPALARAGLGRLPEETAPPAALRSLNLPAVEAAKRPRLRLA